MEFRGGTRHGQRRSYLARRTWLVLWRIFRGNSTAASGFVRRPEPSTWASIRCRRPREPCPRACCRLSHRAGRSGAHQRRPALGQPQVEAATADREDARCPAAGACGGPAGRAPRAYPKHELRPPAQPAFCQTMLRVAVATLGGSIPRPRPRPRPRHHPARPRHPWPIGRRVVRYRDAVVQSWRTKSRHAHARTPGATAGVVIPALCG